ncbi:MAG TPA: polysaccharide deacetylase family protein [Clostridia bacterium]|nr:polysaccharide deacetylase family protein [Clostridia bacterium]
MVPHKKLKVVSIIVFFFLGMALGIISARGDRAKSPGDMQYTTPEADKKQFINFDAHKAHPRNQDDYNNGVAGAIQEDEDNKVNGDLQPDVVYYKKARVLQNKYPDIFIMNSTTEKKRIALTFDDGPENITTPKILDILKENKISATFFVLGREIKRYPDVMERMINEGHQVANHSWSHLRPTSLMDPEFIEEITLAKEILDDYMDLDVPFYYRPPYGLLTPSQIEQMGEKGYMAISWSVDSLDWTGSASEEIQDKVIDSVHPGAIVLMHCAGGKDRRSETTKALPRIIETLQEQGYKFVTIDDLLNNE